MFLPDNTPEPEQKQLATWGTDVPDDLVLDNKLLFEALIKVTIFPFFTSNDDFSSEDTENWFPFQQEEGRKKEERDERKRKYNVKWNDEVSTFLIRHPFCL